MAFTTPGQHRNHESFARYLEAVAPDLHCDPVVHGDGPLGQSLEVFGRTLANRWVVHPMEGWDAGRDGRSSESTRRRWRRFGQSGAKLIWGGEAYAVQEDGRANPHQLFHHPEGDAVADLAALREEVEAGHREAGEDPSGLCIGLQLTHSGRFARPRGAPAPRLAYHHPVLAEKFGLSGSEELLTDGELEAIGERFVEAAHLAWRAGFHFVDVKCCHGYLLHELLGAKVREGPYGGSLQGRTRLLRRILEGIRRECPDLGVGVRISIFDVYPFFMDPDTRRGEPRGWQDHRPYRYGFGVDEADPRRPDLTEPLEFLGLLRDLDVRAINLTAGSPYYCPHLQRPAAFPPSDGYQPPEDPLRSVACQMEAVRACKRAFPDLVMVGSGYSYLQEFLPGVAQHEVGAGHVDLVGIGRMVLAYPEMPLHSLRGQPLDRRRICRTFSDCTTAPRHGLPSGCYPLDPHYRGRPEADRVREIKKQAEVLKRRP